MEIKYKRLLRLEEKAIAKGFQVIEQQIGLLEKAGPEFAGRHVDSDYRGQLLWPGYLLRRPRRGT